MEDYKNLPYFAIKAECKKQGLDSKGTKVELLARLGVTDTSKAPAKPEPEIKALAPATPSSIQPATEADLARFLPKATSKPKVDTSIYALWLTNERLSELENQLSPLAASKGNFKFEIDHDNASFQVGLYGGAAGPISTTLIDQDAQIVAVARAYYAARLAQGKNGLTSRL